MASGFNPLCMTTADIRRVISSGGSSRFNTHTLSGSEAGAIPRIERPIAIATASASTSEVLTNPSRRYGCRNKAPDQMVAVEPLALGDDIRGIFEGCRENRRALLCGGLVVCNSRLAPADPG